MVNSVKTLVLQRVCRSFSACMNSDSHLCRRSAEYLVVEFSTAVAQSGYYSNYHLWSSSLKETGGTPSQRSALMVWLTGPCLLYFHGFDRIQKSTHSKRSWVSLWAVRSWKNRFIGRCYVTVCNQCLAKTSWAVLGNGHRASLLGTIKTGRLWLSVSKWLLVVV